MSYTFATVIGFASRDGGFETHSLLPLEIDEGNGTPSPPHSPGPWPQTPRRVATPISLSPEPASPGYRSLVGVTQTAVRAENEKVGLKVKKGPAAGTKRKKAGEKKGRSAKKVAVEEEVDEGEVEGLEEEESEEEGVEGGEEDDFVVEGGGSEGGESEGGGNEENSPPKSGRKRRRAAVSYGGCELDTNPI
ncbi:hypothetical protein LTS10_006924 [Elasticomyces elasticus]|nr:hypothetical protein LTS10_006924 [Elasticomyces elasticus]